jgi:uncharacterized protein (TIGR03083 family)
VTPDAAIAAYSGALQAFVSIAGALPAESATDSSGLPGWTVADVVAHVVAVEVDMAGHPLPSHEPDWAALPHVGDDPFQRVMEVGVDLRRGRAWADLLAELQTVVAERLGQIAAMPRDPEAEAIGPFGMRATTVRVGRIRAFDLWAHEQDLRRALDRPGGFDGPGWPAARATIEAAWPIVISRQAQLPAGTAARLTVTGDLGFTLTAAVGEDGRGAPTDGDPQLTLTMDAATCWLLSGGRIDPAAAAVTVAGDSETAARLLAAMAITP